ncbi:uncharacterized protein [Apostichopus japonicus]|uniref:uncharacterized protein n=1 Tax=Stichopus japonicus TaxID=307972 RepID=UPI003AB7DF75
MGSRISSKAKDNDNGSNKRLLSVSNFSNAINNSDPVSPKEEANDKTKEDEVKNPVERQQEKETMSSGQTSAAAETTSSGATSAAKETQTSGATSAAAETTSSGATSAEKATQTSVVISAAAGGPPTMTGRVISGVVAFSFLVIGCVSISFYFVCYIGDKEHYLRFFGHMSYRPSLVLAPLIVFLAACKTPEKPYTSWENVFVFTELSREIKKKAFTTNKCKAKLSTCFIYLLVLILVCGFKLVFFLTTLTQCGLVFLIFWLISEFLGVLFFVSFCYFLYLQRLVIQVARKKAKCFFEKNVGFFKVCSTEMNIFFQEYHPLRSLMLPLMYIFLFESTFGIVIFLTWHYKDVDPPNGTSSPTVQPYWSITTPVCPINCPAIDFNHLKSSIWYNIWIVSRHIMTILLPYWSVSGMDLKYIWDDLRTELYFSYSENHDSFRNKLTVYMKGLHPDTSTYTVLNIIVPLMALAAGIFTVDQL